MICKFYILVPLKMKKNIMEVKENLRFGEGIISGYISVFLGISTLLGVICFKYPEWLTIPEFREIYTGESMNVIWACWKLIFQMDI